MLSPYRILDLTDGKAWLCGLVLAQLGAEVITVEPPGGYDPADHRPWWRESYLRGRVLIEGGVDDLAELAATADVVVDSGAWGIDLSDLRSADPALITVSMTPFGDSGPKAGWQATDLTLAAASGHMILNGDDDRPPVRISEPQAYHHAATEAAVHLVAALIERQSSGLGQHIDVAAQHAMTQASQMQMLSVAVGAEPPNRYGGGLRIGPYELRLVYPASDGHVAITFLFGDMIGRFTQRLMDWVHAEGYCSDEIQAMDYVRFFEFIFGGELDPARLGEATDAVAKLTSTMTKAELLVEAMARNLLIAPVATTADTLAFDQFEARDYWEQEPVSTSPSGAAVRHPGAWAKATVSPLRRLGSSRPAGADNERLAGLLDRRRPPINSTGPAPDRPLEGMRILDFSWVLAGPLATRLLADLGATVVRIENEARPDVIRAAGPFLAGQQGGDATALWHSAAAGKYSLELDIGSEAGRSIVLDLARWADLAFESFSAGALHRLGLGYDELRSVNRRLVMASSSLLGQTGPLSGFAGFGNLAASLTGFFEVTGWADRAPAGPYTAYTDYVSPRFAALACLAAVDHARRTGVGQYLDISQAEAASHLLTPALLAQQLDGVTAGRLGNADPRMTPHGAFPAGAAGDDRWIAIACEDDAWPALVDVAGLPADWSSLDRVRRRSQSVEIEAALAAWTAGRDPDELTERLQAAGVAAHAVQHSAQVVTDTQLAHRDYLQQVDHPRHGSVFVEGSQARWSRTQPRPAFGGPPVGEHTQFVLEELLGYDADKIAELIVAGAMG